MTKSESGKKFALIAAICHTVYTLYFFGIRIIWSTGIANYLTPFIIILSVAFLVMAVSLFIRSKKVALVAVGAIALIYAYSFIDNSKYFLHDTAGFVFYIYPLVTYAIAVVIVALSLKGSKAVRAIWFIPPVVMIVALALISSFGTYIFYVYGFNTPWAYVVFSIIEIAALFFMGMWLKKDVAPAQIADENEHAPVRPQTVYSTSTSTPAIGGADKLKMYKELLDSGIITQEEFDAKKKQVLGL